MEYCPKLLGWDEGIYDQETPTPLLKIAGLYSILALYETYRFSSDIIKKGLEKITSDKN